MKSLIALIIAAAPAVATLVQTVGEMYQESASFTTAELLERLGQKPQTRRIARRLQLLLTVYRWASENRETLLAVVHLWNTGLLPEEAPQSTRIPPRR